VLTFSVWCQVELEDIGSPRSRISTSAPSFRQHFSSLDADAVGTMVLFIRQLSTNHFSSIMNAVTKILFSVLLAAYSANAFAPVALSGRRVTSAMAVVDIDGEAAFDKTISSAGGSLVIVDYSTTWCGPCKVIAPKFDEFSEKYPDAVFLKVGQRPYVVNEILDEL
jgi:thiol-disulfide isomerase/thioredoxin